jgi:hypothetical protein
VEESPLEGDSDVGQFNRPRWKRSPGSAKDLIESGFNTEPGHLRIGSNREYAFG